MEVDLIFSGLWPWEKQKTATFSCGMWIQAPISKSLYALYANHLTSLPQLHRVGSAGVSMCPSSPQVRSLIPAVILEEIGALWELFRSRGPHFESGLRLPRLCGCGPSLPLSSFRCRGYGNINKTRSWKGRLSPEAGCLLTLRIWPPPSLQNGEG